LEQRVERGISGVNDIYNSHPRGEFEAAKSW